MSQQEVKGDCGAIRCIWENIVRNCNYFTLVEDDSKDVDGKTKQCFTRIYALKIGKEITTYRFIFLYNYKTKMASVAWDNIALQAASIEARHETIDNEKLLESITRAKSKL